MGCGVVVGAMVGGRLAALASGPVVGVPDARRAGARGGAAVAAKLLIEDSVDDVSGSPPPRPNITVGDAIGAEVGAGGTAGSGALVGAVSSFSDAATVGVGCLDWSSAWPGASAIEVG